jgi:RNA ligase (TIGR02306 family)
VDPRTLVRIQPPVLHEENLMETTINLLDTAPPIVPSDNRKLVTIRQIKNILPIDGADKIECAVVDGWNVVVGKGEYQIGDQALYYEIDSFLPIEDPRYALMISRGVKTLENGKQGHRLKTIRLRGVISQGLLMPLSQFPELTIVHGDMILYQDPNFKYDPTNFLYYGISVRVLGDDLSDLLGIVTYEPPIPACLSGKVKGLFPGFAPKTDEERCENLDRKLDPYWDQEFECSIKMDGTSCTIFLREHHGTVEIGVCSRNFDMVETEDNTYWKVARQEGIIDFLEHLHHRENRNLAFQGEIVGTGIQGEKTNNEEIKGHKFFLFRIWDIDANRFLSPNERMAIYTHALHDEYTFEHVPIVGRYKLSDISPEKNIQDLLKFADGPSWNPNKNREGIVFKQISGDFHFKCISRAYLLSAGEDKKEKKEKLKKSFQFYCEQHKWGWNIDENGVDSGCRYCLEVKL